MRQMLQRFLVAATVIAAVSQTALAQNTVTLEGLVKGEGGAPLQGAQISAVNVGTGEMGNTITRASVNFA